MESALLSIQGYLTNLFTMPNFSSWLTWIILPAIVHELGHYVAARYYGKTIKFRFAMGNIGPMTTGTLVLQIMAVQ